MSQFTSPKLAEKQIELAIKDFWGKIRMFFPEIEPNDLPEMVKHNFPILCMDAVDRALKHAREKKKEPVTSEELLAEIVEQLNMLPNSKLLTCTSYQLIEKINKHLDSK